MIERDREQRVDALEAWLNIHRLSDGTLPFDRLAADIAFTAGWRAKRDSKKTLKAKS